MAWGEAPDWRARQNLFSGVSGILEDRRVQRDKVMEDFAFLQMLEREYAGSRDDEFDSHTRRVLSRRKSLIFG